MTHMKHAIALLLATATLAFSQTPRPPVGVPADAKHFNGRWYKVILEKVPWHTAKQKAAAMRGQLAVAPDADTWKFLTGLTTANVWIGATDEKTEGVWEWIDGSPVTGIEWYDNQPDNSGGSENYLIIWKGRAADIPKDGKVNNQQVAGFICEWKPK